ncbi:hypothetical protein HYPSUDRAFT_198050 [Hypholoma sublateritium FD-334 SS-4]|uniref:Uncharacterized protein n=1 Tax=Hypholoma sublateritium (strain FD-334 SS-4) TaxID=945553 RepID=A0A0D2LI09_HYPSF|nr:hypothetical protein HYPSUDRAFT_198050 [Hypholoma sublateritium FD-334 SS-4]
MPTLLPPTSSLPAPTTERHGRLTGRRVGAITIVAAIQARPDAPRGVIHDVSACTGPVVVRRPDRPRRHPVPPPSRSSGPPACSRLAPLPSPPSSSPSTAAPRPFSHDVGVRTAPPAVPSVASNLGGWARSLDSLDPPDANTRTFDVLNCTAEVLDLRPFKLVNVLVLFAYKCRHCLALPPPATLATANTTSGAV